MGSRQPRVDLYCEDQGHELFTRALISRLAEEEGLRVSIQTRSGRGGHGRAISEFRAWQRAASRPGAHSKPELLVLVIDGNCQDWGKVHRSLLAAVDTAIFPRQVVGCPDPHIERWCIADPLSFKETVGASPLADPGKCDRRLYKNLLRESIAAAGQPILTDAMEFAPDLVLAMDLYRAAKNKNQRSLRLFLEGLRKAIRTLA